MFCDFFWNLFRVRGMARFCRLYMDKAHRQRKDTLAVFWHENGGPAAVNPAGHDLTHVLVPAGTRCVQRDRIDGLMHGDVRLSLAEP